MHKRLSATSTQSLTTPYEAAPMADETLASVIPLHKPKKAKTGAERARAYRQRKKDQLVGSAGNSLVPLAGLPVPASQSSQMAQLENPEPPPTVTSQAVTPVTQKRRLLAPLLSRIAALALAVVGIGMNGWYGRSLGSSVSGSLPPPCRVRADGQDTSRHIQFGSHIWLSIYLTLRNRGAEWISRSVRDVDAGGATRSRGGSWRSRMRRARSCRRWHAGTAPRPNIFSGGARQRVPAR